MGKALKCEMKIVNKPSEDLHEFAERTEERENRSEPQILT
jgi:hypothetical protein